MLQVILKILFSNRVTGVLLILFATAMAVATFIENDYGTETSKALIYSAKWFEILLLVLAFNFLGNIAKYNLFSWRKAPIFIFHIAFVVVILGAGVTKYRGFEGLMTIKENQSTNKLVSIDSYLQVEIGNEEIVKNYAPKKLLMSQLGTNKIKGSYEFENKTVTLNLKKYVPNAIYELEPTDAGNDYLHVVIASKEQRKNIFIKKGTRERIFETTIAYNTPRALAGEIFIKTIDDEIFARFPEQTNYFVMAENKSSFYPKDSLVPLQFKALSTINDTPIVFNTIEKNKHKVLKELPRNPNIKNPESAIVLELASNNDSKTVTLFGGKGYMNPKNTLFLDDLHINLRYGSKPIPLDFSLYLNKFTLERYPGSNSPSAFFSDIKVQDQATVFDYKIFMNNVLNYKGYRFFQSAYLPDESGTILSVNYDYWGTFITYIGYGLLATGMCLSLVWKTPFINRINKRTI